MTKSFRVKANLEVSFEVNSNVAKNSTYIEKLAKANLRKAVSANSFNLAVTEVDDAAIIELYKKHGKEICRRILHSKNNLGRSVKLTSEEINEAVNAFSFASFAVYSSAEADTANAHNIRTAKTTLTSLVYVFISNTSY